MIKLIVQITKVIIVTIVSLLFQSCTNFYPNLNTVVGNGNTTTVERTNSKEFTSIEAKRGIEVFVSQGNDTKIVVEADENLHEHILTKVENGVLHIYTDASFKKANAKKVWVELPIIENIKSSSGAIIIGENKINSKRINLDSSSGSSISIFLNCSNITCKSSSGSEIKLSGLAENLEINASSGSSIKAHKLVSEKVVATSSSGSTISISPSEYLMAKASSGSSITYNSKPKTIAIEKSSGGSIELK
jgi:uncharacterized protein YxeA